MGGLTQIRMGIVTPTLNAERYLQACLESIWGQDSSGTQVEHIIVDGGSTDGTIAIAERFPSRILTGRDRSMYEAINKGMAALDADVATYLNADDELAPGALKVVATHFRTNPRVSWLCGRMQYMDATGGFLGELIPVKTSLAGFVNLGWCSFPQQALWFRTSFFDQVGPFDISYRYAGDYEWVARALAAAPPAIVPHTLGRFRLHEANLSSDLSGLGKESRRVREEYSHPGILPRTAGYWLKLKVNLRSPAFLLAKKTGRLRFWT